MTEIPGFQSRRRLFLQAVLLGAAFPRAWAGAADTSGVYRSDLPHGPFGRESTAEEVTAGLDLTGMTVS